MKTTKKMIAMLLTIAMIWTVAGVSFAEEVPQNTEQPVVEATQAPVVVVETPAETPAATETPAVDATTLPNVSIVIRCTNSKPITVGDTVKLTAEITGIDWHECTLQWQYLDGDEWKNASSGNDITYSYVLTDSNLNTTWRLAVTIG